MLNFQPDNSISKLVVDAYLAPASVSKPKYRPQNKRFWCAVNAILIGNLSFAAGLLLVFHLSPLVSCVLAVLGIGLVWGASRWIDPRVAFKACSTAEWFIATIGAIPTMAVIIVMCRFNPYTDFGTWYINPFVFPVAWMLASNSYFQVVSAIRDSRLDRNIIIAEGEPAEGSFDTIGLMLREQPPIYQHQ